LNTTPSSLCEIWLSWFLKHGLWGASDYIQRLTDFWITLRSVFAKSNGSPSFVASVVSEAILCRRSEPPLLLLLLDWCVRVLSSCLIPSRSKKPSSTRETDDPRRGRTARGEGVIYRVTGEVLRSASKRAGGEGALEPLFERDSSCMLPSGRCSVILNEGSKRWGGRQRNAFIRLGSMTPLIFAWNWRNATANATAPSNDFSDLRESSNW